MSSEDRGKMLDTIWGEVRQLVLNDGPATEAIDSMIADHPEFRMEAREAMIAHLIAFHCAQVTRIAPGPLQGAPSAIIFAAWAQMEFDNALESSDPLEDGGYDS
jgi:hypothetical protein